MRKVFSLTIVVVAVFGPVTAGAGERVNEMALGAASGALVAGPLGLVAGGVIGYVAGPDIGRNLGLKRRHIDRSRSTGGTLHEKAGDVLRPAGEDLPDAH